MSRSFGKPHSSISSSFPHFMPSLIPSFLFFYEPPPHSLRVETSSVSVVILGRGGGSRSRGVMSCDFFLFVWPLSALWPSVTVLAPSHWFWISVLRQMKCRLQQDGLCLRLREMRYTALQTHTNTLGYELVLKETFTYLGGISLYHNVNSLQQQKKTTKQNKVLSEARTISPALDQVTGSVDFPSNWNFLTTRTQNHIIVHRSWSRVRRWRDVSEGQTWLECKPVASEEQLNKTVLSHVKEVNGSRALYAPIYTVYGVWAAVSEWAMTFCSFREH